MPIVFLFHHSVVCLFRLKPYSVCYHRLHLPAVSACTETNNYKSSTFLFIFSCALACKQHILISIETYPESILSVMHLIRFPPRITAATASTAAEGHSILDFSINTDPIAPSLLTKEEEMVSTPPLSPITTILNRDTNAYRTKPSKKPWPAPLV